MSGVNLLKPLAASDLRTINRVLKQLEEMERALPLYEECGADCEEQRRTMRLVHDRLLRIKTNFFPGQP